MFNEKALGVVKYTVNKSIQILLALVLSTNPEIVCVVISIVTDTSKITVFHVR